MKIKTIALSCLMVTALACSCAPNWKHYPDQDYKSELSFVDNFLICQFSDLHFSTSTKLEREFDYMKKAINSYAIVNEAPNPELAKPNLLVLNGDSFMNANKFIVKETFNFLDSLQIPYAFTYGNHDYQGSYSSSYIDKTILQCQQQSGYAMYKNPKYDDVYGNSNYVIDLKYKGNLMFQLYFLDSNSYLNGRYDNIHENQVDWYERMLLSSNNYAAKPEYIDETTFVKSLAFFHIPTMEFKRAIEEFNSKKDGDSLIYEDSFASILEKPHTEGKESEIMKVMHEYKSTVGVGVGHDHANSSDIWYSGDSDWPIRLIYGNKSGDNGVTNTDTMGVTFYSIKENINKSPYGNDIYFSLLKVLVNYEGEVKVQWKSN